MRRNDTQISIKKIDAQSLRSLCGTIAASDFDTFNRIKAIAQVAHEYLGTSSIIVYAYNLITSQLDIVAMPGVPRRELMRGPSNKLIFFMEKSDTVHGRNGVWLENNGEFDKYMTYLTELAEKDPTWSPRKLQRGSFRDREALKYGSSDKSCNHLSTAKIYLWKGLGQTDNPVGQVFFNFSTNSKRVFTPEMRELIRFVSHIIRELLIDTLYHKEVPAVHLTPEHLLRQLDAVLDWDLVINQDPELRVKRHVAKYICDAAMKTAENYGGYADFIFLIGENLGCVLPFTAEDPDKMPTILIKDGSISATCIKDRKYFIGTGVVFQDKEVSGWPSEFKSSIVCDSVMVAPVVYENEVRALIRLTSPREGCFLDPQARAMQTLELFARYGILLLEQVRQRRQLSSALDFYTRKIGAPRLNEPEFSIMGVVSALGADWGTYWHIDERGDLQSHGIKCYKDRSAPVSADDKEVGIRIMTGDTIAGFSQALVKHNTRSDENTFFVLHALPLGTRYRNTELEEQLPEKRLSELGIPSEYYLQVFSKNKPPSDVKKEDYQSLADGFYCYGITDDKYLPGLDTIKLSENTPPKCHTRVAFMIWDNNKPKALVWLIFPALHEIMPWERRYIMGLSNSLGKLLQVNTLELAIRSFRHMVPSLTADAHAAILTLLDNYRSNPEIQKPLDRVETYMLTMALKSAEIKAVLSPLEQTGYDKHLYYPFDTRSIGEYVNRAIACATSFYPNITPWKYEYDKGLDATENINGVFYSVLLNILKNVVRWGWKRLPDGYQPKAYIWMRKSDNEYYTCVGNTGNPLEKDPMISVTTSSNEEHGVGLRVAKALLQLHQGDIRYISKEEFSNSAKYADAPEGLKKCDTFFEFHFPIQEE